MFPRMKFQLLDTQLSRQAERLVTVSLQIGLQDGQMVQERRRRLISPY